MVLLWVTLLGAAGTIHLQTPMLAALARHFDADAADVGWVATLSFAGYVAGTVALVPIGDRADKRRLIIGKMAVLIVALLAMAAAPTLTVLAAAGFVVGVSASVSQDLIPLGSELAAPAERGRAVGTLLSGLFVGILFGRISGGLMAAYLGWRWAYVLPAGLIAGLLPLVIANVPSVPGKTRLGYPALMRSLVQLLRDHAELRRASVIQALLGVCYGGFWATLAQMMATLHGLGPTATGLIAIPGAAGTLLARSAGRWMDRYGAAPTVIAAACLVIAAYFAYALVWFSVAAVVLAAALLDCGIRSSGVANQTLITGLDPAARSRSNTVFIAHTFGGYSVGAFIATLAWVHAGWLGVCASGLTFAIIALLVQLRAGR
jgi:predicted MFS family arabinose efflux permease